MATTFTIKPLSNLEVSSFCGQMAMILQSGISSIEGVMIMIEDSTGKEEKELLQRISDSLQETGNLANALEETGAFPAYMIHMVLIGEQAGKLDEVMQALSEHYDREDSIAKTIKNAVTYPLIMVAMMIAVILILMIKVMPIFNQVFKQLGKEMTGFSRTIMNLGTLINRYAIVLVIIAALILILILYFAKAKNGRTAFLKLCYKFRFSRSIYESMAACRFASGMALTLSSGINPDESLNLTANLIEDPFFREKVDACKAQTEEGVDFSKSLADNHIFSGMYARMASIGSKTGSLDQVMSRIAGQYESEIDNRLTHLLSILEPTLVIILSLIVGVILLSVMLPLLGIMAGL